MGLIDGILGLLFGSGRNVVKNTVDVIRDTAEPGNLRGTEVQMQAMRQHGAEFQRSDKGRFDRFMDGVNRLPRPLLALGTLGLFVSAMVSPLWFSERMQGIALVPEPLWWLLGVIVSFYFGARHQVKSQQFQREIAQSVAAAPAVLENIREIRALQEETPKADAPQSDTPQSNTLGVADTAQDAPLQLKTIEPTDNPALDDWRRSAA